MRVQTSRVNDKDRLACIPDGRVLRSYPIARGIDLTAAVAESSDPRCAFGRRVVAIGREPGVSHSGGFADSAHVLSDRLARLPSGLTLKRETR